MNDEAADCKPKCQRDVPHNLSLSNRIFKNASSRPNNYVTWQRWLNRPVQIGVVSSGSFLGQRGSRELLFVQAINEGRYPVIVKSHTKLGACELRIQPIPASDLKIAYTLMTVSLSPIIITTSRSSIYKNVHLPPLFSPFTYKPQFTMQRQNSVCRFDRKVA